MEELERFLIADESRRGTFYTIMVRKHSAKEFRLYAVPSFPTAFNPLLLSYVCAINAAGRLQLHRSVNYFLLAGYGMLFALLIATALSDEPSDMRELPWLAAIILIYAGTKISGMMTLRSYVRKLQLEFDSREQ